MADTSLKISCSVTLFYASLRTISTRPGSRHRLHRLPNHVIYNKSLVNTFDGVQTDTKEKAVRMLYVLPDAPD